MALAHEQINGDQYLTFVLAGEEYAVDILRVQEIRGWSPVTRIPNTPAYMKGVLNLRGAIIPVVDLRERFGLPNRAYDATTVVVVLWVNGADHQRCMGVVVDAVADTCHISSEQIRPAPLMDGGIPQEYLDGLATQEDKMIIMLDIDGLMNTGDLVGETDEPAP